MNFTSYEFLVFLFIVIGAYWLLRRHAWQNLFLLGASYVFYAWAHPWYALLLGASTLGDYGIALAMQKSTRRNGWLAASLALNLLVLGFFKYYNFFIPQVSAAFASFGLETDAWMVKVLLPAGLSFFTLKKIGYVLDVWKENLKPTSNLVSFALFVSFFPQINAGPIDRAQTLLPQIDAPRAWKPGNFYRAWPLLVMGLFKKIVVANGVGATVGRIFTISEPTGELALAGALGFSLQVLADFSAYTDLSRGIALLLGFETPENFRAPYTSLTPTEFWNRWHMSLSFWLRDYIFFPLRRKLLRARLPAWLADAAPPLVTMLTCGIWHGAGWTFIAWGAWYGVLIVLYQAVGIRGDFNPANPFKRAFAWLVMFAFINFGWLLFSAPSLAWVGRAFANPFFGTLEEQSVALLTFTLAAVFSAPMLLKHWLDRRVKSDSLIHSLYYAAATVVTIVYINSASPDFVYFQF
ncbi:MAG: Peptidoglycan O-acetyltransferase [Anaerolineales bacterium]|nr:Peptidoglycan O-acetyltransferase [Anaerolineales bacterium]